MTQETELPDALPDWVYAERQLMASFDAKLMESHAAAQLSRALNTRRLIAVVGSGVSAGYGLPTWPELLGNTVRLLNRMLESAKADVPTLANDMGPIATTFSEFAPVWAQGDVSADDMPVAFEVCENLYAALRLSSVERMTGRVGRKAETKKALRIFRDRLKWQLRDERGRAEILLARLATEATSRGLGDIQIRIDALAARISYPIDLDGRPPSSFADLQAERFGQLLYLCPPSIDGGASTVVVELQKLSIGLGDGRAELAGKIAAWIDLGEAQPAPYLEGEGLRGRSSTVSRPHLIEAGLELLGPVAAVEILEKIWSQLERPEDEKSADRLELAMKSDIAAVRAARADLPRHRDPFAVLTDELNVKRLLTTNYDGEIDRLLHSRGYSTITHGRLADETRVEKAPSRSIMMDGAFNSAEIMAYEPGAAAYLFEYGADTPEQGLKVLHLHGRARRSESWLVLSERDYRERYARDDDPRAQPDDAMRLVFNSNPLLFVGLGMKEPDILKPLRAFSEDVSRLCDRPAIALLPQETTDPARSFATIRTLAKYGVYTLYHGKGRVASIGEPDANEDVLAHILEAQGKAWKALSALPRSIGYDLPEAEQPAAAPNVEVLRLIENGLVDVEGGVSGVPAAKAVLAQMIAVSDALNSGALQSSPALCPALRTLNQGVRSVALSTFMTAWLRRMVGEWKNWHRTWSSAPNVRERGGSAPTLVGSDWISSRHRTLLRNLDLETDPPVEGQMSIGAVAPETDRFFAGAPSPAFQILRAALTPGRIAPPSGGRRMIYLLSERGAGRGHVFFRDAVPRVASPVCAIGSFLLGHIAVRPARSSATRSPQTHTAGISRAFYNLGVSHEIISTFDRLTRFLQAFAADAPRFRSDDALKRRFERDCEALHQDRLGKLHFVLGVLSEEEPSAASATDGAVRRAVVVFNHFDALFDDKGEAKNTQLRQIFDALTDARADKAPIDFIFMMNERRVPSSLRKQCNAGANVPSPEVALLEPENMPADERRDVERRRSDSLGPDAYLRRRRVAAEEVASRSTPSTRSGTADPASANDVKSEHGAGIRTYVHFLRWMRPVTLAARFFPRSAVALLHLAGAAKATSDGSQPNLVVSFAEKPRTGATDAFRHLGMADEEAVKKFQSNVRQFFEDALTGQDEPTTSEMVQTYGERFGSEAVERLMLKVLNSYAAGTETAERRLKKIKAIIEGELRAGAHTADPVPLLDEHSDGQLRYFGEIATAVGHGRYAMTVVLAAIDDMIARRLPQEPLDLVDLKAVHAFLDRLKITTAGKMQSIREDIALAQVLQLYQTDALSSLGTPLPCWPYKGANAADEKVIAALSTAGQPLLYAFQEAILITLALIGQPVEASVLTGVDTVARCLWQIMNTPKIKDEMIDGQAVVNATLDLLAHRCLIFRIAPKGDESQASTMKRHRFVTHKSLRRHLFRQFHAPTVDYADVDQFTVSMYATQPSDLPRPTAEGHRRVRSLIEQLSRFERRPDQPAHHFPDPFIGEGADGWQVQRARLRAAYGMLRSIYSIAVVSRFSTYEDEGLEAPENGYFENHRLRVRWMLRMANALDGEFGSSVKLADEGDAYTFHAEEIVWLFNECGVLSLVEGRIGDAVALLTQARRTARQLIEPTGWGPLHVRIGLNRAVANIVRGRLSEAEDLLQRIVDCGKAENTNLVLIARGYLILIRDLRGDQQAIDDYDAVIRPLVDSKRFRPAALFAIQKSDSVRALAGPRSSEAEALAALASGYAIEGGHEDVRRIAQLAGVAAQVHRTRGTESGPEHVEAQLGDVNAYARLMGMPRLTCRVALAKCEFFMRQGDYRMAAELAETALQIATKYEIEASKVTSLRLLGTAMLKLRRDEARTLLVRARELAHLGEFRAEANKIEDVLADRAD